MGLGDWLFMADCTHTASCQKAAARTLSRGQRAANVLNTHHGVHTYKPGIWGPKQADALIATDGSWHNPTQEHPSA